MARPRRATAPLSEIKPVTRRAGVLHAPLTAAVGREQRIKFMLLVQMVSCLGQSQAASTVAASAPMSCATMKAGTPPGEMPANVSDSDRAIVTAGFAKDVDAVNQYAAVI